MALRRIEEGEFEFVMLDFGIRYSVSFEYYNSLRYLPTGSSWACGKGVDADRSSVFGLPSVCEFT